ncbi:MAG TPA: sugar phosphate isomerase/epimerase family protein [Chryseosolibacter sp.]|nr:sugar phosphate isomerase/epimerase family protein [Chryseosolibacter sp.]
MKPNQNFQSRRNFIRKSVMAGALLPLMGSAVTAAPTLRRNAGPLKVHVFSKHLQFLNYNDMAEAAAEIGFDGVDLTVRPKGHVLPEHVAEDLPKAVEAIRKAGLSHTMMTTAVQDATNSTDKKLLETAAKLGIDFYRMNWLRYPDGKTIPEAITQFQETIKNLGTLNKKLGIVGCYQNHSGNLAGASLWELWDILQKADKQHMGVQYDIRHAVVEGGLSWKNGLRLIRPDIKILAIKDFLWAKKNGAYVVQNVPLGEGMVDFKAYFALLKEYNINVPVSLHYEYPLGGAEHGGTEITVDRKVVFDAMKRDLQWLHNMWNAA